ncbi:hypothetical protein [Bacillus coahuilensis]|uniref:hypothetical protein n=1 Tax=Bacillus coahuilensis TaxID=408580 RepID=UPI00018509B5|nr:hypothetical protein [Bacillus coahuilensis]
MEETFAKIVKEEQIKIPTTIQLAKRVQHFSSQRSVDFIFDEESNNLLEREFPLNCRYNLKKKIAENIIILHREKYRKNDKTRLELMEVSNHGRYRNDSFYYTISKKITNKNKK